MRILVSSLSKLNVFGLSSESSARNRERGKDIEKKWIAGVDNRIDEMSKNAARKLDKRKR